MVLVNTHRGVLPTLHARVRSAGAGPLLTHYAADGARTELSATSFANWVDKTANLLDELGLDADADVALPVALEAPGHWMTLVWPFALWQRGVTARVCSRTYAVGADLAVIGPHDAAPVAADTLACSLHPWALPLTGLPAGVADFAAEALAQPDAHAVVPPAPGALAWVEAERRVSHAEVAAVPPESDRVLAVVDEAWAVVSTLVAVILGGGSLVVVESPDAIEAVARAERARPLP